jgi:ATP-binding cassette, subfamily B, bacterial MsbA
MIPTFAIPATSGASFAQTAGRAQRRAALRRSSPDRHNSRFTAMTASEPHQVRGSFTRLFAYVRPYAWVFALAVVLSAVVGALEAVPMALIGAIVDGLNLSVGPAGAAGLPEAAGFSPVQIVRAVLPSGEAFWPAIAATLVAVTVLKGAAEYAANLLMTGTGLKIVVRLRRQLYEHVLRQSPEFFQRYPTNVLTAHLVNDTEKVQLGVSYLVADLLREGFTLVALLAGALWLSWRLTLVFLVLTPLIYLVTITLGRRLRRRSNEALVDTETLLGTAQEAISGISVVKAFGAEEYERERFGRAAGRLAHSQYRSALTLFLSPPLLEFIGIGAIAVFLLYAQSIIFSGAMTPGGFFAWVFAIFRLYDPARRLSRVQNQYQQAFAASDRIFALLDTHTEIVDPEGAVDLGPFAERIELRGVSFRYPGSDRDVLERVDLTIRKGEVVALVGHSGSGKSTLAALLLRLLEPHEGAVLVDGVDVRHATMASLRRQVALVTQETILFDGTVRENIAYGRDDLGDDEVAAAARAAHAHGFIEDRPEGYGAPIGERGLRLSGGQRQRLTIARALVKDAPILVLDEATSALDTQSEREVQRALANLMEGRTTLVIAHRLSTIQRADKIVVLDGGRVVEQGRHEDLIGRGGLYRALYDMQFESGDSSQNSDVRRQNRPEPSGVATSAVSPSDF